MDKKQPGANEKHRFGDKIRAVRDRKGMTLRDVALRAGVSESLISQIERNRISPAIDTLLAIVDALDIDFEYLFSGIRKRRSIQVVRKNERKKVELPGIRYERLVKAGRTDEPHRMEAYLIELQPGSERGNSDYGHPGKELGIILEGYGELVIGGEVHAVEAGDSISFESDVPHIIRNTGTQPLRAHWVVTPPKYDFDEEV